MNVAAAGKIARVIRLVSAEPCPMAANPMEIMLAAQSQKDW
jgi:NADP-dependent 3-hydroxy acid dehydrogenase YdfG